jgi:hypothetical protein
MRRHVAGMLRVTACQVGRLIVIGDPAPPVRPGFAGFLRPDRLGLAPAGSGSGVRARNVGGGGQDGVMGLARYDAAAAGHRDRFAPSGAGLCGGAAGPRPQAAGRGPGRAGGDLAGDVTGILASLRARRHGQLAARDRAERAVAALGRDGPA